MWIKIKNIYYNLLLWKYKRNANYYDEITAGQSEYYHEKINEIKYKMKQ